MVDALVKLVFFGDIFDDWRTLRWSLYRLLNGHAQLFLNLDCLCWLCHSSLFFGRDDDRLTSAHRVVVVAFEERLDGRPLQHECVLFDLLRIIILPAIILIGLCLVKIISVLCRLVWSFNCLFKECIPVIVFEPNMLFHFCRSVEAEAITRFSLQTFIYEVSCFNWPTIW